MSLQYTNFGHSTLVGAYTAGDATITVTSAVTFPATNDFWIKLGGSTGFVVRKVTGVVGAVFTLGAVANNGVDANVSAGGAVDEVQTQEGLDQFKLDVPNRIGPATSYLNPGGMGDRRMGILITSTIAGFTNPNCWAIAKGAGGAVFEIGFWPTTVGVTGDVIWDFQRQVIIDEATYNQGGNATAQGTVQFAGSNDNITYTNIGGNVALTGLTTPSGDAGYFSLVITAFHGNVTPYRYIRMRCVSGNSSNSPFVFGMEWRITYP